MRVGPFHEHVAQSNGLSLSLSHMDWALVMRVVLVGHQSCEGGPLLGWSCDRGLKIVSHERGLS